jgi:polygalacturonase
MKHLLCILLLGCLTTLSANIPAPKVAPPVIPSNQISLIDTGGVGDGQTLNTAAFAKAIDSLSQKGGGRLVVPPGIWLTGPITLASRIDLHLQPGALIQFSGDYKLYPLVVVDLNGHKSVETTSPINGQNLEDVAITGLGIIDGGGYAWRPIKKAKLTVNEWAALIKTGEVDKSGKIWWPSKAAMNGDKFISEMPNKGSLDPKDYEPAHQSKRPIMIRIIGSKRLLIEGVTIQNPPNWTINPVLCEDISIIGVKVHNSHTAQNSDALDLESCRRAIVRGCIIDTGDDGLCIKSGKDALGRSIGVPTEDVLIEDCTVYRAHGGFTIGSEMSGGVRNIRVNNCTFIGSSIGLRFKSARGRGGVVENIHISNIRMLNIKHNAIDFTFFYGNKAPDEAEAAPGSEPKPVPVTEETPLFKDIHMENIICRGAGGAIALSGLPEMPLRNITLKNVSITADKGVTATDAEGITFTNVEVINSTGERLKSTRVKNCQLEMINTQQPPAR